MVLKIQPIVTIVKHFMVKGIHRQRYNSIRAFTIEHTTIRYENQNSNAIIRKLKLGKIPMVSEQPAIYQLANTKAVEDCFKILDEHQPWHSGYVGFDTETTIFRKDDPHKVSMIQIATHDFCLLIQIYRISKNSKERPQSLINFLKDDKVLKVGVNASGDNDWLERSYGIQCDGIFNLDALAREKGYVAGSLRKLADMFSDLKLDKSKTKLRGYNFDAPKLNPSLIKYAAEDAFASIQIYENLRANKLNETFLNYENSHPMTINEEDAELNKLLDRELIRGRGYKRDYIITTFATRFQRWMYTKPNYEDLMKASNDAFQRFLDKGILIPITAAATSIMDLPEDITSNQTAATRYKIPGIDPKIIFSSSYIDEHCNKKSLTNDEIQFIKAMWLISIKQISRDTLTRNYYHHTKQLNREMSSTTIYSIINSLEQNGVFSAGSKTDTVKIDELWLKELENDYEKYIGTGN
ncbi:12391_t:CDS:2 [Entrophospora sp. SA101]|nr:12391_t:CDS:2 [Entrophospora sp. SA101]